jgi:subtilisin family serine protease
MKAYSFLLTVSAMFIAAAASAASSNQVPGEVIVQYKDGVRRSRAVMDSLYDAVGVQKVRRFSPLMHGLEHLILNKNVSVEQAIAALNRSGSVEWAQPNYILHIFPTYKAQNASASAPLELTNCWFFCDSTPPALQPAPAEVNPPVADPGIEQSYGLAQSGAVAAWNVFKGTKDMIVADIDSGIDYNHEDLAFNLWRNPNPGAQQDIVGFDFVHNDGLPYDDNEHGTHTAGTIGAVGGNGIGTSGVSQRVSLMALKFVGSNGSGDTAAAISAIDYAVTHGARILSNSWGGVGDDNNKALQDAIDRARVANVLFIAAAGNEGADNDGANADVPASFNNDNIIAVAATDKDDELTSYSNYGATKVHLAAPGNNVYSTVPNNRYATLSGTSMACPHVAGAAALVWGMHPSWTYQQVKAALLASVDVLPGLQGKVATGGRLNVAKALSYTPPAQ